MQIKALFIKPLQRLDALLDIIPEPVLQKCLAEDMLPAGVQTQVACNFALRGYCPLVGHPVNLLECDATSKRALQAYIRDVIELLQGLPEAQLDDSQRVQDKAGFSQVDLPHSSYLYHYILPNFYFHISMLYAIARANGVPLGKGDFDGYHRYPQGFSFVPTL